MHKDLHPIGWWIWALSLAALASFTTNFVILSLIGVSVSLVVVTCRGNAPWAMGFRLYVLMALTIVFLRIILRSIFHGADPLNIAFISGLTDGLRLGVIIICIGAANSLANPKQLLKFMPTALNDISVVLVVAVSVFPQLVESVNRVKRARVLRPRTGRISYLRNLVVPVLEDAFDRSLALAASMEVRGYGRTKSMPPIHKLFMNITLFVFLLSACAGMYFFLDQTAPKVVAWSLIIIALLFFIANLFVSGKRVIRTSYRKQTWTIYDYLIAISGVITTGLVVILKEARSSVINPELTTFFPNISLEFLLLPILILAPIAVVFVFDHKKAVAL